MDMSVPHTQAEIEAWVSQQAQQARAEDDSKGFLARVGAGAQAQAGAQSAMADSPIGAFIRHVPQNVTGGVLDAAIATADKLNTLDKWLATPADVAAHNAAHPEQPVETEKQLPGIVPQEELDALRAWRESVRPNGENMGDTVAQGIAQFAVPFTAFAKVFGLSTKLGLMSNIGRAAGADIAATTVAMPSHSARGSTELLELGRKAETNFGAVLREVAPDDGLITRYINWMNDTTNESTLEGEFKNSLDTLSLSGATAGLIKSAATTFKLSLHLPEYVGQNLGPGPMGRSAQKGMIGYHGTRHELPPVPGNDLGAFDLSKVGTGEGVQAYGHGIYLAEEPQVARGYMRAGVRSRAEVNGVPSMEAATTGVQGQVAAMLENRLAAGLPLVQARQQTERWLRNDSQWARIGGDKSKITDAVAFLNRATETSKGNLYHVDIPDKHIAKMLDWDKPLSEQPKAVQDAILGSKSLQQKAWQTPLMQMTGKDIYWLGHSDVVKAGIPGIKYLDAGSRGAKEGTRNFVIFDPSIVKIIKREGK